MKLVNKLIALKVIKKEDTDLYEYSISILKNYILFFIIVFLVNLFTENYITTFIFLFIFFLLRKYTGGLHMESSTNCLIFSILLTLIIPYIAELLKLTVPIILGSQLVISLLIALFPIIETPQKYVSSQEKKIYKKKSMYILFSFYLLNIIFIPLNLTKYSVVVVFTLLISLISILLGFVKYKYFNNILS